MTADKEHSKTQTTLVRLRTAACVIVAWACAVAWPPASVAQKITVNELNYMPAVVGAGFEAQNHEWVEIYNADTSAVDLTGWAISNRNGVSAITLPPWTLPSGCFLTLHQAVGIDDNDFDDLDGHYYTAGSTEVFDDDEDECGLYSGSPGTSTIVDFVSWSNTGSYTPGIAHGYAVSRGIWTPNEYYDSEGLDGADCLGRYFDGYDRDLPADWHTITWWLYALNTPLQPENPLQESPYNRSMLSDSMPTFEWTEFADADFFHLQVDTVWDFSSPVIDASGLLDSTYTPLTPLPDDGYFWRVRAFVAGSPTPWTAEWLVVIQTGGPRKSGSRGALMCPHKWQRKDTELLCLWDERRSFRPGCAETGAHCWDAPHPNASPSLTKCKHCRSYCVRASIAMMNAYYKGNLSQDRISYHIFFNRRVEPEGDLGHGSGVAPPTDSNAEEEALEWALNYANVTVQANPSFDQIKGWLDQLDCFMARIPGHMMVLDDYSETIVGTDTVEVVWVQDPSRGPWFANVYRYTMSGGAPARFGRRFRRTPVAHVFLQPTLGVTGRTQEATVTTDLGDGDGIMDFDEKTRTLSSSWDNADTDGDEVPDKDEVRNYTYHFKYHVGHYSHPLSFSDWDGDGLRSESDCDSDNDGDFDGGEDIDGDGRNPETGETCMFDPGSSLIKAEVNKNIYRWGEPVFITMGSGTFHASSTYNFEWGPGCPDKEDNTPLVPIGSFTTNDNGYALPTIVHYCDEPGQYYLTVDVLNDNLYSEPDNTDPQTCWWCKEYLTCACPPGWTEPYADFVTFTGAPGDCRAGTTGIGAVPSAISQAGTTWVGAVPPYGRGDVGPGGVWDFDDGGTSPCPVENDFEEYIEWGAYAQHWTSQDVFAQRGTYWHAEDFSDPGFACNGNSAINGAYSAWCGKVAASPGECFVHAPGYGSRWNQWLCLSLTLDPVNPTLEYQFTCDTQPSFDYVYVVVDAEFPDSCGWIGDEGDSIRCYTGPHCTQQEQIDLANWYDGTQCDEEPYHCDYSGDSVKVCFVVVSDGAWDDEDGKYDTCDGAFTVDDIIISTAAGNDTTTFETGTLDGWTACGGWSPGDYAAIRHRSSFLDNDVCSFENCDMADCVLTFYNPNIPGQYGCGGHYYGSVFNVAFSPIIDLTTWPPRGYVLSYDLYADLPTANWVFYRPLVTYMQDPHSPVGAWSPAMSDDYVYYTPSPSCGRRMWGFSHLVPTNADSIRIGLAVWSECPPWATYLCTNGNESPIFDNVRVGLFDLSAPVAGLREVDNYTDAFPEDDNLVLPAESTDPGVASGSPETREGTSAVDCHPNAKNNTALIDAANNKSQGGAFLRLADSLVICLKAPDVYAELCFKIRPGPCTDITDPWWGRVGLTPENCLVTEDYACVRMDTALAAGDGDTASAYEYQVVFEGYYASLIHEDDPRYWGEGEEIFPDSLFTPGTKIYYAIRTSFLPGPGPYAWLPFGASMNDLGTLYEVEVLPNRCRLGDEMAPLLYVDYYNRGAQGPIEDALTALGRTWDRMDLRAESSHQGNGIGNRLLGAGKYRLARGPIGPSNDHLQQYNVMLVNNGDFASGVTFSDGGTGMPDDPSNDIGFLDQWLNEGRYKGLWLNGNNITTDFATAPAGPKPTFLNNAIGASLVAPSYRDISGHPPGHAYSCRDLCTNRGLCQSEGYFDQGSEEKYRVYCSGCSDYDVVTKSGAPGIGGHALIYDHSDVDFPPGLYASVYHIFRALNAPNDTVRVLLDGFGMQQLRDLQPEGSGTTSIALWIRKVLGGHDWTPGPPPPGVWAERGYFFDRQYEFQYCPPEYEDTVTGIEDRPGRSYPNALFQNYPNPFRTASGTTIRYSVAKAGVVEVRIFDVAGRLVNTIVDEAELGDNVVVWDGRARDGRRLASGMYFYSIRIGEFVSHKKMILAN